MKSCPAQLAQFTCPSLLPFHFPIQLALCDTGLKLHRNISMPAKQDLGPGLMAPNFTTPHDEKL